MHLICTYFMPYEELVEMSRIYNVIDAKHNGILDKSEIEEGLCKMGLSNVKTSINKIFDIIDID